MHTTDKLLDRLISIDENIIAVLDKLIADDQADPSKTNHFTPQWYFVDDNEVSVAYDKQMNKDTETQFQKRGKDYKSSFIYKGKDYSYNIIFDEVNKNLGLQINLETNKMRKIERKLIDSGSKLCKKFH